jgi:hypothetical protein
VTIDPNIPDSIGRIVVRRANILGRRWDIEATGTTGELRPADA